jgi:hypothetical protein
LYPTKKIKTRSTSYEFRSPEPIRIEFDESALKDFKQSKQIKASKEEKKAGLSKLKQAGFNVGTSLAHDLLNEFISKRILESEFLKNKFSETASIPEMKKYISGLKMEVGTKKDEIKFVKSTTKEKRQEFEEIIKTQKENPKPKVDQKAMEELEEYVENLKLLDGAIKQTEDATPETFDYEESFKQRHTKIVAELDSNGISLNDKLTKLLSKQEEIAKESKKLDENQNGKAKQRDDLKKESKNVDDKVTMVSKNANVKLHKFLKMLIDILTHKGDLREQLKKEESDIIEYNAIFRELTGGNDNAEILRDRNKIIQKKKDMIKYLDKRLENSENGTKSVFKALQITQKFQLPQIKTSDGKNAFAEHIDDLKTEQKKCKELRDYLVGQKEKSPKSQSGLNKGDVEKMVKKRQDDLDKLQRYIAQLVRLNHEEFSKQKEVKVLEGKLLIDGYSELEKQKNELQDYLKEYSENKPASPVKSNPAYDGEIIAKIEQQDRIIIKLINQLRNLDDKILYIKSNQ